MENIVDINDLLPRYILGNSVIILVYKEDFDLKNQIGVMVDFGNLVIGSVQETAKYLTYQPYKLFDLKNYSGEFHDKISRKFKDTDILSMLIEFTKIRFGE